MNEEEDYNREMDEKEEYKAELIEEVRAKAQAEEQEDEAEFQHEEDVKHNPMKIIIESIIEQQEKGQLSPQTMDDLKLLLDAYEVSERL